MLQNKSTKIWVNYLAGMLISGVLLYLIYLQLADRLRDIDLSKPVAHDSFLLLFAGLLLLPVNLGLEIYKWKLLASSAAPVSGREAALSCLAGIAVSFFTPNRIGEYPGRILYLNKKNTPRLLSVSVLGAFAQLSAVMFFGLAGLIYYNIAFPGRWQQLILAANILVLVLLFILYLRFETWAKWLEGLKWLRRFRAYRYLLRKFTTGEQLTILLISLLRFVVFTCQYLIFMSWLRVELPLPEGFLSACLFFWAMTVIPSVAFAEIGIRGNVGLFLFGHFSENALGILEATVLLWCVNLVLPAVVGSLLLVRLRLIR